MRYKQGAQGFALPTVVITAVILFAILVAAMSTVSSVRVSLDAQYYDSLARDAVESGAAKAKMCASASGLAVGQEIRIDTDCNGVAQTGAPKYLQTNAQLRTYYKAVVQYIDSSSKRFAVTGYVELVRKSSPSTVWKTMTSAKQVQMVLKLDPLGDRVSKRFWCFGEGSAGLDFGTSGYAMPTVTTCPTTGVAYEGSTTITDANGNLIFWSNGKDVWGSDGQPAYDAVGGTWSQTKYGRTETGAIAGGASTTQAVAAFPMNSARTKYGVVGNTGMGEWGRGELYLSIIQMDYPGRVGKPTIIAKNQQLGSTTLYSSEGLGAMPNNDGTGYYVYAYAVSPTSQTITGFLIKNDGTVDGPIVTNLGTSATLCSAGSTVPASDSTNGYGTFNFNMSYTRMALLIGAWSCSSSVSGTAYILTPDRNTGQLTVNYSWQTAAGTTSGTHGGYSADFSPQEKYLYVSQIYPGTLARYDITQSSSAAIKSSEQIIATIPGTRLSALTTTAAACLTDADLDQQAGGHIRRGPDDRMYLADHNFWYAGYKGCPQSTAKMSVINAPDASTGTVAGIGLVIDGITLPGGTRGVWGLPQMVTVYAPQTYQY